MEAANPPKNRKRPHRNNPSRFRAKVKRYSKMGRFGRGTNIEDTDFQYFLNIVDSMKGGFESVEEKELMACNVLEQTKDKETFFASNQVVSKILESLIGFGDNNTLERYFTEFSKDFRPSCSDPFASHVLQKLLEIAFLRSVGAENLKSNSEAEGTQEDKSAKPDMLDECNYNLKTDFKMEHREKCREFVERLGKFLLNNLEDFVWDNCANHIMRTAIYCLAGIHMPKVAFQKSKRDAFKNRKLFAVEPKWHEVVKEYAKRLSMWPQFVDLPYQEVTSALLGVICLALHQADKKSLKHFGMKLLTESFLKVDDKENDNDDKKPDDEATEKTKLPKVFRSEAAINLLETLLNVAGPKVFVQLHRELFSENLETLALERSTNFSVQNLINNIRDNSDFEKIIETLCPHAEKIIQAGNTGVLLSMATACIRLSTKQAVFVTAMQKALHVVGDATRMKSFLICLLKLKPYEIAIKDESNFMHLHGTLIVQHILKFNKPILLVNCILETPANMLCGILNTPHGSYIANSFLESKYVGEKSREKLIRHLNSFYVDLATQKFGSRVIECLFAAAQETQKLQIVKALAEKENLMMSTPYGRLLHSKFMLRKYRLSPAQWKASYLNKKQEEKAKDLFEDIIN